MSETTDASRRDGSEPERSSGEHPTAGEPYFVSAGVESALTEAARPARDINIGGALYRKVNHGQSTTPAEPDAGDQCRCAPNHAAGFTVHQHPCRFAAEPDAGDERAERIAQAIQAVADEHEAVMDARLPMPDRPERESGRKTVRRLRSIARESR